jgi:uncharacterized protein (DUF1800 family)
MPNLALATLALHRFGFGAAPGDAQQIAGDPRGWVKAQLRSSAPEPAAISALPAAEDDLLAFGRWLASRRLRNNGGAQIARAAEREGITPEQLRAFSLEESYVAAFRDRYAAAVHARITAAVVSPEPVRERLVHFWSNHFTVSGVKPQAVALPPSFERDVVRGHLQGAFATMLIASCQHPGMLIYLDNWLSAGPNSVAVQGRGRGRRAPGVGRITGLNENLAREVLELHTMGVGSGYSQDDVRALATILTGWTYARPDLRDFVSDRVGTRAGGALFTFDPAMHEPGVPTLLGVAYPQEGVAQGVAALTALARQPATAQFLATKLTRHFLADTPPPAVVDRVARAYRDTDGALPAMMEALVDSPEAWEAPLTKFRRPEEYLIALMRAIRADTLPQGAPATALAALGQRPYAAPGPNGWPDTEEAWMGADLVWKRVEFAGTLAGRMARADLDAVALAEGVLGPFLSAPTREALTRAESPEQALTLFFACPELQRR